MGQDKKIKVACSKLTTDSEDLYTLTKKFLQIYDGTIDENDDIDTILNDLDKVKKDIIDMVAVLKKELK